MCSALYTVVTLFNNSVFHSEELPPPPNDSYNCKVFACSEFNGLIWKKVDFSIRNTPRLNSSIGKEYLFTWTDLTKSITTSELSPLTYVDTYETEQPNKKLHTEKKGYGVNGHVQTKSLEIQGNNKAKEQRFYRCSSSWIHPPPPPKSKNLQITKIKRKTNMLLFFSLWFTIIGV